MRKNRRTDKEPLALRPEVVVASGNHDVGFDPRPEHIAQWLAAFPEATLPQVVERGPVTFIGFDSQIYNARRTSPEVDALAEAQWKRLVAAVAKARARGKRVMLYCHIPAIPSFFRKKVRGSWKKAYLPRFLALLRDHQVEATLSQAFHLGPLGVGDVLRREVLSGHADVVKPRPLPDGVDPGRDAWQRVLGGRPGLKGVEGAGSEGVVVRHALGVC